MRSEAERRRSLEIVDQGAGRLSHLVENVLQFSRAERQAIKLRPVDDPLAMHVRAAHELFEPIVRARRVRVAMALDETIRCPVDPGALRQILLNLLDNAVKYTPAGGQVDVLGGLEDGRCVVRVRDSGLGIEPKHLPRVFERFYRVDKGRSRDMGGTGLGLAIVKHLVGAMEGEVKVESQPHAGSTFTIFLPAAAAQPATSG